jgi:hypothetical protein
LRFWLIEVAEGLAYTASTVWRRYMEVGVSLADPIAHDGHSFARCGSKSRQGAESLPQFQARFMIVV